MCPSFDLEGFEDSTGVSTLTGDKKIKINKNSKNMA